MRKILTVLGARPQFVKASMVSRVIGDTAGVTEVLVHTGQHFDDNMSAVFFDELKIPRPHYHLGISGGLHGAMTGKMLAAIEEVLVSEVPDLVLIYGDTNSTLAGALAASKLHVPVAHVEAGLRSFNRRMPEEINRVVSDHVSTWLFTPTDAASKNLTDEGIPADHIHQVGDVMFDAALFYAAEGERTSRVLSTHGLSHRRYVLATIHRQENTDVPARLCAILEELRLVAAEWPVVIVLHPRTRTRLEEYGKTSLLSELIVLPPVGYLDMVTLERSAAVIATDSGGVQKEAYFYRVPCVTLREETEWVELLELGWNRLAPPGEERRVAAAILSAVGLEGRSGAPYGDGQAARRVIEILA